MSFAIQKNNLTNNVVTDFNSSLKHLNILNSSIQSVDTPLSIGSSYLVMDTSVAYPPLVNIPITNSAYPNNYAEMVFENHYRGITQLLYSNDPQTIENSGAVKVYSSQGFANPFEWRRPANIFNVTTGDSYLSTPAYDNFSSDSSEISAQSKK